MSWEKWFPRLVLALFAAGAVYFMYVLTMVKKADSDAFQKKLHGMQCSSVSTNQVDNPLKNGYSVYICKEKKDAD